MFSLDPWKLRCPETPGWRLIYAWSSGLISSSETYLLGHFEKFELPIYITRSKGCSRVIEGRRMKRHWMSVPDRILVLVGGGTEAASPQSGNTMRAASSPEPQQQRQVFLGTTKAAFTAPIRCNWNTTIILCRQTHSAVTTLETNTPETSSSPATNAALVNTRRILDPGI